MKTELQKVSAALAGAGATTPTANMVRISDGRMWAYGGMFCLSTSFTGHNIESGFYPKPLIDFYKVDHANETFTVKDGTLSVSAGNRILNLKFVPAVEVQIIDVIRPCTPVVLNVDNLKRAVRIWRRFHDDYGNHGIEFKTTDVYAGSGRFLFRGESGLPMDLKFTLPGEAVEVLADMGGLMSFSHEQGMVRFDAGNGDRIVSRTVEGGFPETADSLFIDTFDCRNTAEQNPIDLKFTALDEIRSVSCEMWEFFENGCMNHSDAISWGSVENAFEGRWSGKIGDRFLQTILAEKSEMDISIQDRRRMLCTGEDFGYLSTLAFS